MLISSRVFEGGTVARCGQDGTRDNKKISLLGMGVNWGNEIF